MIGGSFTERLGTAKVLSGTLVVWGVLILAASVSHGRLSFGAALVGIVTIGGLVDVVANVAATAALAGRPGALVRFHAFFNVAGALGAAAAGALIANHISWQWTWTALGVVAIVIALFTWRAPLPAGEAGENIPLTAAISFIRRERLVIIALAFAFAAMVENGTAMWGVLLLRTKLSSGLLVGATSAVAGFVIGAGARAIFGPLAGRRGAVAGVVMERRRRRLVWSCWPSRISLGSRVQVS